VLANGQANEGAKLGDLEGLKDTVFGIVGNVEGADERVVIAVTVTVGVIVGNLVLESDSVGVRVNDSVGVDVCVVVGNSVVVIVGVREDDPAGAKEGVIVGVRVCSTDGVLKDDSVGAMVDVVVRLTVGASVNDPDDDDGVGDSDSCGVANGIRDDGDGVS
jgi:hypothetical protein